MSANQPVWAFSHFEMGAHLEWLQAIGDVMFSCKAEDVPTASINSIGCLVNTIASAAIELRAHESRRRFTPDFTQDMAKRIGGESILRSEIEDLEALRGNLAGALADVESKIALMVDAIEGAE